MQISATARLSLLVFIVITAVAQTPPTAPKFEVASIKPQTPTPDGHLSVGITISGNRLTAEHVSLQDLVEFAYELRDFQVSGGPSWVRSDNIYDQNHFVISAKAQGDAIPTLEQMRGMMRTLLLDRFQLQVRFGKKDVPVYNLVVAKGGPKLTESAADAKFAMAVDARKDPVIQIKAQKEPMGNFAKFQLTQYSGRPVVDKTGLTGFYDLNFEWVQEDRTRGPASAPSVGGPGLLTALQEQLGLRLESATAPYDAIVIERVEKPSEN